MPKLNPVAHAGDCGGLFAAGFGDEAALIRIAAAFEDAMPWADRKPPIHVS